MTKEHENLYEILKASLWSSASVGTINDISDSVREELRAQAVEGLTAVAYQDAALKYRKVAQFVWMTKAQTDAVNLLQQAGIAVVVMKGTASGMYYPIPCLRTYGDIDLLVQPENYHKALELMSKNGYLQSGDVGKSNTAFYKDSFLFELHQYPAGLEMVKEGDYILQFMLSGFRNIQTARIAQPECSFPVLPWQQNGLELIWHFREHLYNGIGLRHAIDWMMFVHNCLDDKAFAEYADVLDKAGLLVLAKTVTKMCQMYLGLEKSISWCNDADEETCAGLMDFIMEQGNFGHKRTDDKAAKVLTKYRTPVSFFKGMQHKGEYSWIALKKYPYLKPFAWVYVAIEGGKLYLTSEGRKKLRSDFNETRERQELFDRLYSPQIKSSEIKMPHVNDGWDRPDDRNAGQRLLKGKMTKEHIRSVYEIVKKSPLRVPLYYISKAYFICRYPLFGKPNITESDRENVEKNVTFIYKSFNRQDRAIKLYRVIKRYYPEARVVIADDSKRPLVIPHMSRGDTIIHLPFNSGLSKGLIAALDRVETPYVMRLDDDLLLTPGTCVHDQLSYLQRHPEVDLVAVQMGHINPRASAERFSRVRMNKVLKIPAGTIIDGREVVYKAPNVYLARTESMRTVGFDPNIRMMDHHEFFYRAAGKIVCVQDSNRYVMHCHNLFEMNDYERYRKQVKEDAVYIVKKHGENYM